MTTDNRNGNSDDQYGLSRGFNEDVYDGEKCDGFGDAGKYGDDDNNDKDCNDDDDDDDDDDYDNDDDDDY